MEENAALVLLGTVAAPRGDRNGTEAWLRDLVAELDETFGADRLAPFAATGDGLAGLLTPWSNPLPAVLRASLAPRFHRMRWVAARGTVLGLEGAEPAWTGSGMELARAAMREARLLHDLFVIRTGAVEADALLAELTPVLADLFQGLTARQREVARLALVEGLRQTGVADRLGIRRATVSVSFARARVGSMSRLVSAIGRVYASAGVPAGAGSV